jgi:hypothetical protein
VKTCNVVVGNRISIRYQVATFESQNLKTEKREGKRVELGGLFTY